MITKPHRKFRFRALHAAGIALFCIFAYGVWTGLQVSGTPAVQRQISGETK